MQIWFIIILFLTMGVFFSNYVTQLFNYVNYGLGKIIDLFQYVIRLFTVVLNSLSSYNYIMLVISIFIGINVLFYVLDFLRGE